MVGARLNSAQAASRSLLRRPGVDAALTALAYFVGSEIGYALWMGPEAGGTFWPPAGIALGVLLCSPVRRWPLLIAAALAGDFASNQVHGQALATSLRFGLANAAGFTAGALVLRKLFGGRFRLGEVREVVALAVVAICVCGPVAATIGNVGEWLSGSYFGPRWRAWWMGDALGVLVVTPLVVRVVCNWRALRDAAWWRWFEGGVAAVAVVVVTELVFTSRHASPAMPFLMFPALLWSSLRFGITGSAAALCLVAVLTTRETAAGQGPFGTDALRPTDRVIALQVFLGVMALSFHTLAALWDERTRANEALRRAHAGLEARYRRLVEQSPLAILTMMPDGRVKEANPSWRRLWQPAVSYDGEGFNIAADPQWDELDLRPLLQQAVEGRAVELPERLVRDRQHPESEPRCLRGVAYPVKDDAGAVSEVVVIHRDITEQVRAQRELVAANQALRDREEKLAHALQGMEEAQSHREQLLEAERSARAEAERASRLKDEFLATLSHELRTPLNAILGWAQILHRKTPDAHTLAQALDTIERNARAQSRLIEELLDMSRITSGKIGLSPQRLTLAEIIRPAVESFRPAANAKDLRLTVTVEPEAEATAVVGDAARLQQVVSNLLSNAVKFTPTGGYVDVHAGRRDGLAQLVVRDNGQGIAPAFLPHVFERFRQADGSITRRHGGLGLGLSIVRHIVELHGGAVSAHSDGPGRGSTFTVSLPVAADGAPDESAAATLGAAAPNLAGVRVLVVDDEPDARELLRRLLIEHDCDVTVAASADEALAQVTEHAFDILVSDIGMPGTDGYELLRRVRAQPATTEMPAIAVTAFARPEDRARALAAGFTAHLAKPISPAVLLQVLAHLASPVK